MRGQGIQQQHGQSHRQPERSRHLKYVLQTCNQQALWRVFILLIALLCAQKCIWQPLSPTSQQDESVVFFKLYSTDNWLHHHPNFSKNLDDNGVTTLSSRRRLAQIHGSCPQFRVLGGFSHTRWNQEYYVKLAVGKSKKIFHFQLDTGSQPSWLACKWPTIDEHPPDGPNGMYMPEKQQQIDCRRPLCKALQNISKFPCDGANEWHCICDITYYDDSNFRGLFVEDVVTFETPEGGQLPATVSLVCSWHVKLDGRYATDNLKRWPLTSDGLLGLNKGELSFISQLQRQRVISSNVLGHCFRSLDNMDFKKVSGFMFFGRSKILNTLDIVWTPMAGSGDKNLYQVHLKNIKLGQLSLDIASESNIMVDCGSTTSYMKGSFYNPIIEYVKKQANLKGYVNFEGTVPLTYSYESVKQCWCIPKNGIPEKDFETIHMELAAESTQRKTTLHLKPEQYMSWKGCVADECNLMCFSLLADEKAEDPNLVATIGGFGLQGYLVVHDTEEGRIGWMESDCEEEDFLKLQRTKEGEGRNRKNFFTFFHI